MTENLELLVLSDVVSRLESAEFAYMLTGSVAMNYYAEPRMTRDIDIVVALAESDAERIVEVFQDAYYLSADAILDATRHSRMFNLVHYESVVKIDFIVRKKSAYRRFEFDRRQKIRVGDLLTWIVCKEDLILSKLSWAMESKSEMQLRDVRNLLATEPDLDYLNKWSSQLGLDSMLEECLND